MEESKYNCNCTELTCELAAKQASLIKHQLALSHQYEATLQAAYRLIAAKDEVINCQEKQIKLLEL